MLCSGKSTYSLVGMYSHGRHVRRPLNFCGSAAYSKKADKYDPRTAAVKEIFAPWRPKKSFFDNVLPFRSFDAIKFFQTPIDFRKAKIKSWLCRQQYEHDAELQRFRIDRQQALGDNISVGHVLLSVGAAVRYKGKPWMKKSLGKDSSKLPVESEDGWILEAIDVSSCDIRYEGFENFRNLSSLHTLIAQQCPYLDDWCLDLICGEILSLENLDLSGCKGVTPRGLIPLTRLPNLCTLNLSNIPAFDSTEGQLMCLLLQDVNEKLTINGVNFPTIPKNADVGDDVSAKHRNSSQNE